VAPAKFGDYWLGVGWVTNRPADRPLTDNLLVSGGGPGDEPEGIVEGGG